MKKISIYDVLVMCLSIFYFFLLFDVIKNRGALGWDEAGRAMGGIVLVKYLTLNSSFTIFIEFIRDNHYYVYQGTFLYGMLSAIGTGISYFLFGFSTISARLPSVVASVLTLIVTYLIAYNIYGDRRIAIFSVLFLVSSTVYFDFSTMNFSEILILLSISLGTYILFKVKKSSKPLFLGLLSGIFFGSAAITKPSAIVMILPILIYLFLNTTNNNYKKSNKKKDRNKNPTIIAFILPVLVIGLFVILYWSYLKNIGFYQMYIDFWMGGRGFHPETEPFSLNVFLNSLKLILSTFPITVVLLLISGLYFIFHRKTNSEEIYLLTWIGAYFLSLIASGAISPQYHLPSIPALSIFTSIGMVKLIDLYKSHGTIKKSIIIVFIIFIVFQSFAVPIYKNISLRNGNEVKGESYNPLIIRKFLQENAPSLFWINTKYYNGSTIDFYARQGLDEGDVDTFHILESIIVDDIHKNNYQSATVILLSDLSNYFDFWFTVDDKNLSYRFISLDPNMVIRYTMIDTSPKYLIISKENEKKLFTNPPSKNQSTEYSIYKIHKNVDSVDLEYIK